MVSGGGDFAQVNLHVLTAKLYPNTCRDSFIESWLNVAVSRAAKYGPPDSIKIAVEQWMAVDEAIEKEVNLIRFVLNNIHS